MIDSPEGAVLSEATFKVGYANKWLRYKGLPFVVDNAAILFRTYREMDLFVQSCVDNLGMEHFFTSQDNVLSVKEVSHYDVTFKFLRWPSGMEGGNPFRIEAMVITGGSSFIHEDFLESHGKKHCVHVSLKCMDIRQMAYLRNIFWGMMPYIVPTEYFIAKYGVYEYWRIQRESNIEKGLNGTYLKTRVNLRDQ